MAYPPFQKSRGFKLTDSSGAGADQAFTTSWVELFASDLPQQHENVQAGDLLDIRFTFHHTDPNGQDLLFDFGLDDGTRRIGGTILSTTDGAIFRHFGIDNTTSGFTFTYEHVITASDIATVAGETEVNVWIKSSVDGMPDIDYIDPPARLFVRNLGPQDAT